MPHASAIVPPKKNQHSPVMPQLLLFSATALIDTCALQSAMQTTSYPTVYAKTANSPSSIPSCEERAKREITTTEAPQVRYAFQIRGRKHNFAYPSRETYHSVGNVCDQLNFSSRRTHRWIRIARHPPVTGIEYLQPSRVCFLYLLSFVKI